MMDMNSDLFERLQTIFREILDNDRLRITAATTQAQTLEWDSLAQVALVMAIENEFQVSFTAREASTLVSVRAIADLIEAKNLQAQETETRG
jgi:acyl carrier protein